MGRYHHRDSRADPDHAASSSHAATAGNVLPQQVRIPNQYPRLAFDILCEQQKVERRFFVGVAVASHSGHQKIVGERHWQLQILYGCIAT